MADYQKEYDRFVGLADCIVSNYGFLFKDSDAKKFFKENYCRRKKLVDLFDTKAKCVCKYCGGCCCGGAAIYKELLPNVLFFRFFNKSFPVPDFEFLAGKMRARHCCLFLGRNGCLLGEFRPLNCLCFVCAKITAELTKESYEKLQKNIEYTRGQKFF